MVELCDETEFSLMLFGHLAKSGKIKDCGDITQICNTFMTEWQKRGYKITRSYLIPRPSLPPETVRIIKDALEAAKNGLACGQHMYNKYADDNWKAGYSKDLKTVKEALALLEGV